MPTVDEVVKDPEFQALPWGERHKVMQSIDPEYAALPTSEQTVVLNGLKQLPFWGGAKQKPAAKTHGIVDAFKGAGARMAQGVNEAGASMLDAFGLDAGAKRYKEGAAYWDKVAQDAGSDGVAADIYKGVGSAPQGVAEFMAGVPYAAIKGGVQGYRKGGLTEAAKDAAIEGVKRYGVGKVFHGIQQSAMSPVKQSATMAGTMGAQTAAEGGNLQDVVASTVTGALLTPPTGSGRQGVVRQNLIKGGTSPEVATDLASRLPDVIPAAELAPQVEPQAEQPQQDAPRQEAPPQQEQPSPEAEPQPNYTSKQEPVSPERIQYEIGLTQSPDTSKAAMMLPNLGANGPKIAIQAAKATGLKPLKENGSLYLYNPQQTTAPELRAAIKNGTEGNLLGYGIDAVPEQGVDYAVSVDGKGTTDLPTILQWRDSNRLGFAGRALDSEMAQRKMQEMGAREVMLNGETEGRQEEVRRQGLLTEAPAAQDGTSVPPAGDVLQTPSMSGASYADTGGYAERTSPTRETTQTFLEQPEMLQLAKAINEGKTPRLMERMGNALGRFTHGKGGAEIKLRKDLFAGPQIAIESAKPKQAREMWDAWKQSVTEANPDADIIFRQKYNNRTGQVEFRAYKRDPLYVLKTFYHEIGHNVDYLPDKMVRGRGNILGHVAALKRYMKHTLEMYPTGKGKDLSEQDKARVYEKNTIMGELKSLSQKWKPFDDKANAKYTAYRYSPAELYADATSVLFNEPQLLKDTAPTFYRAFIDNMAARPEFKEAYQALDRLSKDPDALNANRYAEEMKMYQRGNEKAEEIRKEEKPTERMYDTAMRWLIERNHNVLKELPDTPAGKKARYDLEEIPYIAGEAENYVKRVQDVRSELETSGATIDDLSAYLLAKHIIANRDDIANTLGKTAATEKAKLEWMQRTFGPEKFAAIERAAEQFRENRKYIINRIAESGIVTPELLQRIQDNEDYAHIDVQKYMDKQYGAGTAAGAGWKKLAEGTLSDVNNVFTATVLQDISVLRMAKINEAKQFLTDVFADKGLVTLAEMRYDANYKAKRPVDPGGGKELLTVLKNGKPVYYVVEKHVAEVFKGNPVQALRVAKVFGVIQQFIRDVMVSKNLAWMTRNLYKDTKGTIKNNPEISFWNPADRIRLLKAYKQAAKEVWADVMKGQRSADIEMMHNARMLNSDRMFASAEETFDDPLMRIASEFRFGEQEASNTAFKRLKAAYEYLDKLGKVSEQTSKVAGMKLMRDKGLSGKDLAHRVRTRIGTPDYKRQGMLQRFTNNIFMFSNVNKEGLRSAVEAFREDPISYSFKTIEANILPKLALAAAAAGYMGDDLKKLVDAIPSWVKRSYNVIPLPGEFTDWMIDRGMASAGDVGYLRLPSDYEGQFFGALTYDMMNGEYSDAFSEVIQQIPWTPEKIHPVIKLTADTAKYLSGESPRDDFRKKDALTAEQKKYLEVEGPMSAKPLAGMGRHAFNMLGLGNIVRLENREFPREDRAEEKAFKQVMRYLGSYVEFSDAGVQEQMVKGIINQRNQKAIKSYEVGDAINAAIREGKDQPRDISAVYRGLVADKKINPAKTRFGAFRTRYLNTIMQRDSGIKPTSKMERKQLLDFQRR